jgi:hypothetical protein
MSYFCTLTILKSFAMTFFFNRFAEEVFLLVAAKVFAPMTAEGFLPVAAEKEDLSVMTTGKEDFTSVESLPRHHLL